MLYVSFQIINSLFTCIVRAILLSAFRTSRRFPIPKLLRRTSRRSGASWSTTRWSWSRMSEGSEEFSRKTRATTKRNEDRFSKTITKTRKITILKGNSNFLEFSFQVLLPLQNCCNISLPISIFLYVLLYNILEAVCQMNVSIFLYTHYIKIEKNTNK